MRRFRIKDPQTFHLRHRILQMAGVSFRRDNLDVELEQDFETLPERSQRLVKAALSCVLDWRKMGNLNAKEKVAVGVAAMDVEGFRSRLKRQPH